MTPVEMGLIGLAVLFTFLAFGMPIGFAMGLVGVIGFASLLTVKAVLIKVGVITFDLATNYAIGTVPLFLFMAHILFASGIGKDLYDFAARCLGHRRGGLAMATVGASAGFAAVNASSLATTATMGLVALPEMRKHGYSLPLASGSVAAGGTIGSLIPPSGMFIIYGILTETSIGDMFAAGIIPGILLALMYMTVIWIQCRVNPKAGPAGPRASWADRWQGFKGCGDVIVLFLFVMGGIVGGLFTPTEAGAMGAFGALIIAAVRKRLTWARLVDAVYETFKTTGMIFGILFGALVFNAFITVTTIPMQLTGWVAGADLAPLAILLVILAVYFFLGMILDASAMMTLTVPLFFPLVTGLGYDAVLFGVLVVRMTEIALITPPVGMNVYVLSGVARDIPLSSIFRGTAPFVLADMIHVTLLIALPVLVLWLPSL
ncbi:Sialic acid TRAP transporter permease protein SiaT [Pseudooceanicola marinus]|uniref:TRAP transporter large permease protein n=1 Tax=Pseudooceanicola marinus TaxID=396013 RepID=A0A1X7A5T7_9RHOB|nr:TRAP transporter large permease [Pseudooceanicola marinus]PJE27207.1 TRAP transporter large permease [Pseudooceanicola marinus]SLN70911.1 Sialic acid TRAP transporter permease protein SiaT [Pseudooceanicola marinus]